MLSVLFLVFMPAQGSIAASEDPFWTEGELDYHGHIVSIRAIIKDMLPPTLQQIRLEGCAVSKEKFHQLLERHFMLRPEFSLRNAQTVDDFYISEWASGYSAMAGYDDRLITSTEVEKLFPVEDAELKNLYQQCVAFLAELNIAVAEDIGYICRQSQRSGDSVIALLPYQIEGLSTEYKNHIVSRDNPLRTGKQGTHIMDYPWADFVFDSQLRLVKTEASTFQVASVGALVGDAISWKEVAEKGLAAIIQTQTGLKRTVEGQTDYDEEQFWADFHVRLTKVTPMWMPDLTNRCLPGWAVQYQLYDSKTDDFLLAMTYCANVLTGEVACYQTGY